MKGFRRVEVPREQMVLWAQKLDDAVAADHPVRLFDRMLANPGFGEVFDEWRQAYVLCDGRPPYAPRDLAGLYLYGMLNRIRSSRQLEGACHNRVDVMWLLSGQKPDHSTIAGFVSQHGDRLRKLFRQSIRVAISAGLVTLSHVSVDGTKLEADAGRSSVKSEAWLKEQRQQLGAEKVQSEQREAERLEAQKVERAAVELETEWSANEQREKSVWSEQSPPPAADLPGGSDEAGARARQFQHKQQKIDQALAAIERRNKQSADGGAASPKAIASTTDPDARVMPDKQGKRKPGYNAQIAVDADKGIIVALAVNDRPEDVGQLSPMLEQVKEQTGALPVECSADSGYASGAELAKLEQMNVVGFVPDAGRNSAASSEDHAQRQARTDVAGALDACGRGDTLTAAQWAALPLTQKKIDKRAFTYQPDSDTYRCPAGISLAVLRHSTDRCGGKSVHRVQYGGHPACGACAHASICCDRPAAGRTVNRDQYEPHRERMRERMKSPRGRERYRLRPQTVEPRFGTMKSALGVRRFMRRGLEKVRVEFSLLCTAMNLGVLMRNLCPTPPPPG